MFWLAVRLPQLVPVSCLSQDSKLFTSSRFFDVRMSGKRKRSWTVDALCRLDADCVLVGGSEQEIYSSWALIADSDEPTTDATPLLPRFLLQEIIFAHSPCEDLSPNQPRHKYAQQFAYKCATGFWTEVPLEEEREWSVLPEEEPCSGTSMPAKHAKVEEARSVLPMGLGDSTEHHQAGIHRNPLHRRPDSGSCFRRELLVGLVGDSGNQIHSHPNVRLPWRMHVRCNNGAPIRHPANPGAVSGSGAGQRPLSGTQGSCAIVCRGDADAAVLTDAGAAVHADEEAQTTAEEEEA